MKTYAFKQRISIRLGTYSVVLTMLAVLSANTAFPAESDVKHISAASTSAREITLSDGVEMLMSDNRVLKMQSFETDMTFEDTVLALSPLLPHISANVSQTYYGYQGAIKLGSTSAPIQEKEPFAWGVDISQTLFDFGRSLSKYKSSEYTYEAKKAAFESIKRAITLEFTMAYLDVLETRKMIEVAQAEKDNLTSYLKDMQRLYDEGVIVKNDLLPVSVALADAQQKLISLGNRKNIASSRLNTMLAMSLCDDIDTTDLTIKNISLPSLEESWNTAVRERVEIMALKKQINASSERERSKAVENLPKVFVSGGYAYTQNRYQVHEGNPYIMLGAKADLYDGGASAAEVSKERLKKKELNQELLKLLDDIKFEVKNSLLGLNDAQAKLSVAESAVSQAEENSRFYKAKYNNGAATSTDVLEAITLQTRAGTNYFNALYEEYRYYAKYMYSTGTNMSILYDEKGEKIYGVKNTGKR